MAKKKKTTSHKKGCVISVLLSGIDDNEALKIKQGIDALIKNVKDKRLTFQFIET